MLRFHSVIQTVIVPGGMAVRFAFRFGQQNGVSVQILRDRQRQRAVAVWSRQPGQPLFNVKARGDRQIELLGKPGEPIR